MDYFHNILHDRCMNSVEQLIVHDMLLKSQVVLKMLNDVSKETVAYTSHIYA